MVLIRKINKSIVHVYHNFKCSLPVLLLIASSFLAVICFDLKECLKSHKIYPDVIDSVPEGKVEIFYGKKEVNYGTSMSIEEVSIFPSVKWPADPKSLYTLMVTDPDSPSQEIPYIKEVCFWWVANIKGNDVTTGHTVMNYIAPHPSFRKGTQAYVFVVYKQPGHVTYLEDPDVAENQTKPDVFRVSTIAEKYKLGKPIAINLFQIRHPGNHTPAVV